MEANDESTSRSVAPEVGEHSEPHTMPTVAVEDPFFNAAGKAPHPDAVIVKQEAGWFQLWAEKRQKKTAEKLAARKEEICEGSRGCKESGCTTVSTFQEIV
jgi:TPP-dependent indolepyruvate ferredoxin oxidoreductase alpha subunit